jgi:hypothetical protein
MKCICISISYTQRFKLANPQLEPQAVCTVKASDVHMSNNCI